MIQISDGVVGSLVASHNDRTDEEEREWLDELWTNMAAENPGILQLCQSWIHKIDSSDEDEDSKELKMNGFLAGASFVYAAFQRHFESEEFEKNFA
jgi:hypothetical protein